MVAKTKSFLDSLYPVFQLACFLFIGFTICSFGWPFLRHVLGDEFIYHLSQITNLR